MLLTGCLESQFARFYNPNCQSLYLRRVGFRSVFRLSDLFVYAARSAGRPRYVCVYRYEMRQDSVQLIGADISMFLSLALSFTIILPATTAYDIITN